MGMVVNAMIAWDCCTLVALSKPVNPCLHRLNLYVCVSLLSLHCSEINAVTAGSCHCEAEVILTVIDSDHCHTNMKAGEHCFSSRHHPLTLSQSCL